jgi:DNA-binding response OmpR family regulator
MANVSNLYSKKAMIMAAKAKVLLAEDDASLGFIIKDALEEDGYEVAHCADGQSTIDRFNKNEFDICLLDVMMPHKDGFAVAKKIRQHSDLIPILFLTAKSMEEDKIKGFQSGADDYITKPFNMAELLLRMEVFLRRTKKMYSEQVQEFQISKLKFSYTDLKIISDQGSSAMTQSIKTRRSTTECLGQRRLFSGQKYGRLHHQAPQTF